MLERLLQAFSAKYKLSPREKEIFRLLVHRVTSFKDLAARLKTSPLTIKNQAKNILNKTRATSKTDLLSLFIQEIAQESSKIVTLTKSPRILIIDDEKEILDLLDTELTEYGATVFKETDAKTALLKINDLYPDLILSDIRMPQMDGLAFLKEAKLRYHDLPPVIFITGHTTYPRDELLQNGAIEVFEKPIDFESLIKLIQTVIQN
jgi:two-component system response regulator (stage 0 sporulation protein F)